jgi:hypothetical protein
VSAWWGFIRGRSENVVWNATLGLIFNSALLWIFVLTAGLGPKEKADRARLKSVAQEVSNTMMEAKAILATNPEAALQKFETIKRAIEKGSKESSGQAKAIMQASGGFISKTLAALTNFNSARELFDRSLEMSDVQTLEQLQAKERLTVQAFAELEQGRQFFGNLAESYRKELTRHKLDTKIIEAMIVGTGESVRTKQRYLDQEIAAMTSYGENARRVLSLLASNWGSWEFRTNNKTFRFSDARTAFACNTYCTNIQTAIKEISAAEQGMLRSN